MIYSGLTGQFPVGSYNGIIYMYVAYVYIVNALLLHVMKPREANSMVEAFTSTNLDLEAISHKPKLHILDNECSHATQNLLRIKQTTGENVEAHHQNANAGEPASKSAKYHIISHISTMDTRRPIQLWSEMVPQIKTR